MKKEVILAILIGLVMGLFITYGVYQSRTSQQQRAATDVQVLENIAEPSKAPDDLGKITLYSPEDESVQTETSTQITGKTIPNSLVTIFVNETPVVTQADETGNFSKDVELSELSNIIKVHVIDEDGQTITTQRTVVVYEGEILQKPEDEAETENESETQEEDDV